MKVKVNLSFLVGIFCLVLLGSCKAGEEAGNQGATVEKENTGMEEEVEAPKIVFLNYSIRKDVTGRPEIEFINKIVTSGKLKAALSEQERSGKPGDLKCVALDAGGESITSLLVQNPLQKTVEYVNETGQLSKKEIVLDSATFTVRMQLDPGTKSIAVQQLNDQQSDSTHFLIVTKIK